MASIILPDQSYLAECFDYEPATGALRWKVRPRGHFVTSRGWNAANTQLAGRLVGRDRHGYGRAFLCGHSFASHRIIWKLVTGDDVISIDHIDRHRENDAWNNLRAATNQQNKFNLGARIDNASGLKGVHKRKEDRFRAAITFDGKTTILGTFKTKEEAHAAYCEAAKRLFGDFWSPG